MYNFMIVLFSCFENYVYLHQQLLYNQAVFSFYIQIYISVARALTPFGLLSFTLLKILFKGIQYFLVILTFSLYKLKISVVIIF